MFPGFKAKCGTQGTFISDISAFSRVESNSNAFRR